MRFFKVYGKISAWNLSDFLHKITVAEKTKTDVNDFYGESFVLKFEGEGPVKDPKWSFLSFMKKSVYGSFQISFMKYSSMKDHVKTA